MVHYDPDVRSYGGKESYISQCSFFFIDRKNNVAKDLTVIKKPCEASDFSMTIERKHVGHKIRLIMVNETDPNSVTGYTPVPLASLEGRAFETGYILDTPSPSNSTVSIDKNPLSPGETATVTMVLRDINNTPLELTHDLPYGDVFPGWSLTEAKPTGQPGEYTASVTYTGGQNSSPVYRPVWKYYGETLHPAITLNGIP
ncbi:ZirS family two-partner secretion-like system exoprotein [Enterobacter ludwigii]|uniref:ZirS family two-partner secretion-like system exoprotein n=1 Tax=Enterobacter ludwigii TaxID=299767 RepID=UPI003EF250A2